MATVTTTSNAASVATPSTIHRNVAPSEVGWQFVRQYYTFMNKQPERLHCFYTKQSTFNHGTEGDELTPFHGQAEIHEKITSLDLHECKVFIHSVDAQASLGGGIVIQVIGEMSNRDEAWRKFVQTFFLAEQPNGYFVLNDVFRYLKEESTEEDSTEPEASRPDEVDQEALPSAPQENPVVETKPAPVEPEHEAPPAETFIVASKSPAPEPVPELPSVTPPAAVSADWIDNEPSVAPSVPVENGVPHDKPTTPSPAPPATSTPAPESTPSVPPTTLINGSEPSSKPPAPPAASTPAPAEKASPIPAPAPVAVPTAQPAPAKPAVPKTWANLAAANSSKWGTTAAATQATSAAPPPAPTPPGTKTPQRPLSGQAQHNKSSGYQAAMSIQTPAVFIKGVVDPLTNDLLKSFLIVKFGPIKDFEVVRNKACAFVEFVHLQDARKAIIASLPTPQGGEGGVFYRYEDGTTPTRITIETRKERGERPVSAGPPRGTGRGGFESGRGGGNVDNRGSFRGRGRGRGATTK